jgi:DNA-binding response OmpR family regulator
MNDDIILVVDDDYLVSDFLARIVLPKIGYQAVVARTGTSA